MENLILAIALYVVFIAAANAPKNNRTTTEPATVEPETEPTEPKPMEVSDSKSTTKPTLSALLVEEFTKPLEDLTIRELYTAAANAKVKGYKRLNKAQLIEALAA